MVALAKTLPEYHVLSSVPNLGDNTTVRLIAEMGDIKRFRSHKQLNAFAGIDIRRIQSGKVQIKDRITKHGNSHLRRILYLIIQNMIRNQRYQEALQAYQRGERPIDIFREANFNIDMIGRQRPKKMLLLWRKVVDQHGKRGLLEGRI